MREPTSTGHPEDLRTRDLAPAAPPGTAARASAPAGRDEWLRFAPAWHGVMGGLVALTATLVALDDGIGRTARYVALALTAALAGAYAILGGRALQTGPAVKRGSAPERGPAPPPRVPARTGGAYLILAAPLTVGLFAVAPVGALMLFALYPHIWAMLPPRRAIVATAAVVGGVAAAAVARTPLDNSALVAALVLGCVSLVLALLLGLWIARIIEQSRHRAELLAELAAARAELAMVSREAGVLAERERLAHEIHDTLAQGFTSVLLMLEAVETALGSDPEAARAHLDRARGIARENLAEARALVAALTPPDLSRTSLPEALRRLVERADAEPGTRAVLSVTGTPRGLPAEREVAVLRAAQEALTNVRRHSGASRVDVSLEYTSGSVTLRVQDNGRGFDPAARPGPGYGLSGMRARASRVGAAVRVLAAPGEGVEVRVDVPAGDG